MNRIQLRLWFGMKFSLYENTIDEQKCLSTGYDSTMNKTEAQIVSSKANDLLLMTNSCTSSPVRGYKKPKMAAPMYAFCVCYGDVKAAIYFLYEGWHW